jgi:hypothetical protein
MNSNNNNNLGDPRPLRGDDRVRHITNPDVFGVIDEVVREDRTAKVRLAVGARIGTLRAGDVHTLPLGELVRDDVFGEVAEIDLAKVGEHGLEGVKLGQEGDIVLLLVRLPADHLV